MKTMTLLIVLVFAGFVISAQDQDPLPKISQQITNYFNYYPRDKVFLSTDKNHYKPGESIWFSSLITKSDNQPIAEDGCDLNLRLYDKMGKVLVQEIFRTKNGSTSGDLAIPGDLSEGICYLVAYSSFMSSPDQISLTKIKIDPLFSDQWVAESLTEDSISVSGKKNRLFISLHDLSGDVVKNTPLRYQFRNGSEILEKGKLKTDENGKLAIPLTIPSKTNGEPFICELSDLKNEWKNEIYLPTNMDPVVIRLYPEGGNLVVGVPTKIGFTAFTKWGVPVDVTGSVLNQKGDHISPVKTLTKGLGLFSIVYSDQQKYKLVLSGETGRNQTFGIPSPNPEGLAISIVKSDADFIYSNFIFPDQQKHHIALTITQGDRVCWATGMDINGTARLKIPADQLPQGINLLSAFSKEGNLLAERIIFRNKRQELKINIQPEKAKLMPNEKMTVKVRLTDENNQPVSGNITVSVTDKSRIDSDKPQIDEYLLIGSELETPFSLFPEGFKDKISNPALMDIILIANRLKGFDWAKIRQFNPDVASNFNTERDPLAGFVIDKNGNKISKAKVSLVNNKNMQLHTTTTNTEGYFSFPNLNTMEDFSSKATDIDGKRELTIVFSESLDSQIAGLVAKNALREGLVSKTNVLSESYFKNNEDLFHKRPKILRTNTTAVDSQQKLLASSTNLLDVIKTIKPYKVTNNQIVFFGSENSINYQGGALIVMDGQQLGTDASILQGIAPADVDHINVSTNPSDIQRYTGLNSVGVIEIFMKKASVPETDFKTEAKASKYDGKYRIANIFPTEPVKAKLDNRTTLQWIPEQKVDESGQFEFMIAASKVISDFVIEVQGITPDGRMGTAKSIISVTK